MGNSLDKLSDVADLVAPVLEKLNIDATVDLQESESGNQLCIDKYTVCSDGESYDVIVPLDDDDVSIVCFPAAVYVARYIVGHLICRSVM
jgi:hypothetical protein